MAVFEIPGKSSVRLDLESGTQTISNVSLAATNDQVMKLANAVAPAINSPVEKVVRVTTTTLIGE